MSFEEKNKPLILTFFYGTNCYEQASPQASPQKQKKVRFELPSKDDDDNLELKSDHKTKNDDYESADEYMEDDMNGEYNNTLYPVNDYDETYYGEDGYDGFM